MELAVRDRPTALADLSETIDRRIDGLAEWVAEHASMFEIQAHLDDGEPERAYWHCGYLTALRDLRALLKGHDLLN
jgi:hypothetical protein